MQKMWPFKFGLYTPTKMGQLLFSSTSEDVAIANIQHLVGEDDILEVARLSTCLERREASPLWVWPPTVSRTLGRRGTTGRNQPDPDPDPDHDP